VTAAFAKGSVLFAKPDVNYMVHASRREQPGQAEVHLKDADVIYVLGGSATFVTGGSAIDPHQIEPGEIRGREIQGGETLTLEKGDVIIVPAGTPHWFKEVKPPFLYYVVKVR
jgi:mannose-6-phosphate isomerase-like protein (cupin superfamily)